MYVHVMTLYHIVRDSAVDFEQCNLVINQAHCLHRSHLLYYDCIMWSSKTT